MKAINKFFIALFCFISAGICGIVGVIINSTLWEDSFIPVDLEKRLSWFGENPEKTQVIVIVLWIFAATMIVLGVVALWRIMTDKKTTSDEELGMDYKRIED